MTVGARIRDRRKELGIEVDDLAKAVGLKPSTLYDLENGRSKSTTKLHHIARELGVSVEELETGRRPRLNEPTSLGEQPAPPYLASHVLRIDPDTVAAAIKLVRLSFANLGLEFDNEEDGTPLAYAYEYLLAREQHVVTPENLVDFSKKLADRLRERELEQARSGESGSASRGDRSAGQGRKAS